MSDVRRCDNAGCDEVTPWDMAAIILDEKWFCSPGCAQEYINHNAPLPDEITLHDPQFVVDRSGMEDVDQSDVDISRRVQDRFDANEALVQMEEMHGPEFRIGVDVDA